MSDPIFAQSLFEYGSLGSLSATLHQVWAVVVDRAANADQMAWAAILGAALLIAAFLGIRLRH